MTTERSEAGAGASPGRPRRARRRAAGLLAAATFAAVLAAPASAAVPRRAVPAPLDGASPGTGPVAAASAIVPGSVGRTSLDVEAEYGVDVRLGVAARSLAGTVRIRATNRSGAGIDRLELGTVMGPLGALRLGAVTVDGATVPAALADQTITVPLGGVLPDGATAEVVVRFAATLRSTTSGSSWLFTRANGIVALHRWIPWVSRATPFSRPNHGDPFVTPVSPRVVLRLTTDVPLVVVATGLLAARSGDGRTTTFTAERVRDVAVTAAADYRVIGATVGATRLRVAYRPGFPGPALLDAAVAALRRLEARLGPSPYPVLRISQSAGGYAMEGPAVAWIPTGTATGSLPYLVTHELAHQWFYGLVGNDQAREPFADEAPADFVTRDLLGMRRASRCATAPLDRNVYELSGACYYEVVYIQGGNLLAAARNRIGAGAFWASLRGHLDAHRWGITGTRDLLDALDAATAEELGAWWGHRFPRLY